MAQGLKLASVEMGIDSRTICSKLTCYKLGSKCWLETWDSKHQVYGASLFLCSSLVLPIHSLT